MTVLAILWAVGAVLGILFGLVALMGGAFLGTVGDADAGLAAGIVGATGAFLLVYGVLAAVIAWGLWSQKRWAWYAAIVVAGLAVLGALFSLFGGDVVSAILSLALNGFIIWYLLKPEVQTWFGLSYNTPWKYRGRTA